MIKKLFAILTLLISSGTAFAVDNVDFRLKAGINLGGTTPLDLPAEIRKIETYTPSLIPSIEANFHYLFPNGKGFGLSAGLRLEYKGMSTTAEVMQYKVSMVISSGDTPGQAGGYFTGVVKIKALNGYIILPVLLTYDLGSRWRFGLGGFAAIDIDRTFTGEAKDGDLYNLESHQYVESATYDFSKDIRRFDFGAQAGTDCRVTEKLAVTAQLTWSITPLFQKGFTSVAYKLYNIYGNLGFAYLF
ncbi:MAG: PorT family protein [Prevotellaceae bacterium]|jgi:hypothetical protein|nr:PorT family protein [Prevotellaceae bacterium]